MKHRALKPSALNVFLIVFLFWPSCFAVAQSMDNGDALGIVLSNQSSQENVKRLVYKSAKMMAADELYRTDKLASMEMLGAVLDLVKENSPEWVTSPYYRYDERRFLNEYSAKIDRELDGLRLNDMDLGRFVKIGIGGVATYATGGLSLLPQLGIRGAVSIAGEKIGEWQFLKPALLGKTDVNTVSIIGKNAYRVIKSGSVLGEFLEKDLKTMANIGNLDSIKTNPSFRMFEVENETSINKYRLLNVETTVAKEIKRLVQLEEDHREQGAKLIELSEKIEKAQQEEAKRRAKMEALEAKREEYRLEAMRIQTAFAAAELVARVFGVSDRDIKWLELGSQGALAINSLMNSAEDPTTYMSGYYGLIKVAIGVIVASQPNPPDPTMEALQEISQQIKSLQEAVLARFVSLDQNLGRAFAEQKDLLSLLVNFSKGNRLNLSDFSN